MCILSSYYVATDPLSFWSSLTGPSSTSRLPFLHFSSSLHLPLYMHLNHHTFSVLKFTWRLSVFLSFFPSFLPLSFFLSSPTLHLSCLAGEETGGAADFRPQERPIILLKHWGQRGGGKEGEERWGEERVGAHCRSAWHWPLSPFDLCAVTSWPFHL